MMKTKRRPQKAASPIQNQALACLCPAEEAELSECEATIHKHLEAFFAVGKALLAIRDKRLYRAQFKTFEDYCRDRLDISRIHAHRLLTAAEVVENVLLPMGNTRLPDNERQVRPLVGLDPKEAQRVWKTATEAAQGKQLTGSLVANATRALRQGSKTAERQTRDSWQSLIEPLLHAALTAVKAGDRAGLEEILFKVQLNMEIGRDRAAKEV